MVRRPAEPGQVGERRQRRDRLLVPVEEEAGEHERAGDADRGATTEERCHREGERAGGECQEFEPDRVCGRVRDRDVVARKDAELRPDEDRRQEDHRDGDRHRDDVSEQLLDRDRPSRHAPGREELERAAPGFGRQRARQGDDRPEADDDREEGPVFVVDVSTERLDVDGLPGQAGEDRRHRPDDVGEALTRGRGVELEGDGACDRDEQHAHHDRDRDRGAAQIPHRLGEDAAEAVHATRPRRLDGPCDGGHVRRPRPAGGRTRRGTSPRARARG